MANYFSKFPKTYYKLSDGNQLDAVTNIISRFSFEKKFKDNAAAYYKYSIKDGDTPEILAFNIYGSAEKHWVILMFNDIVDPQYDWPLHQSSFINYVEEKYSANASVGQTGIEWAMQNIHSYYRVETLIAPSGKETETLIQVDANTYTNVAVSITSYTLDDGNTITIDVSKQTKTYYDYENELNESKRTIKILKPEFVQTLDSELKNVFR